MLVTDAGLAAHLVHKPRDEPDHTEPIVIEAGLGVKTVCVRHTVGDAVADHITVVVSQRLVGLEVPGDEDGDHPGGVVEGLGVHSLLLLDRLLLHARLVQTLDGAPPDLPDLAAHMFLYTELS